MFPIFPVSNYAALSDSSFVVLCHCNIIFLIFFQGFLEFGPHSLPGVAVLIKA